MAAPDFVPTDPNRPVRTYYSPPRRPGSWRANRPGEVVGGQPRGDRLGSIGPDQGYAFHLVPLIEDQLHLGSVRRADAIAGGVAVAMKRAALFGRAPVIHDLTAGFTVYGFLDRVPPTELVTLREELFAECHSAHHYAERRHLVDLVDDDALTQTPQALTAAYQRAWQANLRLDPTE